MFDFGQNHFQEMVAGRYMVVKSWDGLRDHNIRVFVSYEDALNYAARVKAGHCDYGPVTICEIKGQVQVTDIKATVE